jgi:hypothetical protein
MHEAKPLSTEPVFGTERRQSKRRLPAGFSDAGKRVIAQSLKLNTIIKPSNVLGCRKSVLSGRRTCPIHQQESVEQSFGGGRHKVN